MLFFFISSSEADSPKSVTGSKWVIGSAATASWDACEGANYYSLNVYVYRDSRTENLIGQTETGTSDTSVDVQQEIYRAITGMSLDRVFVCFDVRPENIDLHGGWEGSYSYKSSALEYRINPNTVLLSVPNNIKLTEDYTVSFETVDGSSWYNYRIQLETGEGNKRIGNGESIISHETMAEEDIANEILYFYRNSGFTDETVKVSVSIQAFSYDRTNPGFISSNYSDWTAPVLFNGSNYSQVKLTIPKNIKITEDYVVSFDTVKNSSWYNYKIQLETAEGTKSIGNGESIISRETKAEEDITNEILYFYRNSGFTNETVKVSISVQAFSYDRTNPGYLSSDYSDWTTPVMFNGSYFTQEKLPIPKNVKITEDYVVTFETVKNSSWYNYRIQLETEDGNKTIGNGESIIARATIAEEDVTNEIFNFYKNCGFTNEIVKVSISVQAFSYERTNPRYISSDYSDWTTPVLYGQGNVVKSIKLAPEKPVIYIGRSYYLGKTITPRSARYGKISWQSSNPSVLTVDSYGRITGIVPGDAEITASISEVKDSVTVKVYEVESNITDAADEKTVTGDTGIIIDSIMNSDLPDLTNTDIDSEELPGLKEQIMAGFHRVDEFRTDLNIEKRGIDYYKGVQDLKQWLDDYSFAYGADVTLEMYHKEPGGAKHHIGNLIQLSNEIHVTLRFPRLREPEKGFRRIFTLLKIHKGNVRKTEGIEIDESADGTFEYTTLTDQFSDFILLYKDVVDEVTDPIITVSNDGNGLAYYEILQDEHGTKVILYAIPYDEDVYEFDRWRVISGNVTISENAFYMGKEDIEVKAYFKAKEPENEILPEIESEAGKEQTNKPLDIVSNAENGKSTSATETETHTIPKTGDSTDVAGMALIAALGVIGLAFLIPNKKRTSRRR